MIKKTYTSFCIISGLIIACLLILYLYPSRKGTAIINKTELWRHRCNTIEESLAYGKLYSGIEIDVVFTTKGDYLDVRHNIEDGNTGLNLLALIDTTKSNNSKYWIDIKNLKSYNVAIIIQDFEKYLIKNPDLKRRIIFESSDPQALNQLSQSGYYTSYWVPHYDNSFLSYIKFFFRTKPVLIQYRFNALSAQHRMLPFLKFFYPNQNFHIWTDDMNQSSFIPTLKQIKQCKSVKVILVDYETNPIPNE